MAYVVEESARTISVVRQELGTGVDIDVVTFIVRVDVGDTDVINYFFRVSLRF